MLGFIDLFELLHERGVELVAHHLSHLDQVLGLLLLVSEVLALLHLHGHKGPRSVDQLLLREGKLVTLRLRLESDSKIVELVQGV